MPYLDVSENDNFVKRFIDEIMLSLIEFFFTMKMS